MKKLTISAISLLALGATSASFAAGLSNSNASAEPLAQLNSVIKIVGLSQTTGSVAALNVEPVIRVSSVAKIMRPNKTLATFDAINCVGDVDLTLQQSAEANHTPVHTVRDSRQHIRFSVRHHVLYIKESQQAYMEMKPVKINIPVNSLRLLTVAGNVTVKAKGITTKGLYLNANTSGTVSLEGHVNLSQLTAAGHSKVNLRWVDSKKLVVSTSGVSHVKLSGVVKQAWVHASDRSHFNGMYLRVKEISADTKNYATSKLLPVINLFAYARDESEIKLYKEPHYQDEHTRGSGNIMQVEWRK